MSMWVSSGTSKDVQVMSALHFTK
uniref:Uncharacterized protein n=1 Tax=Anguilla anguilla TaxID=7936 RepID=A0A0E9P8L0_ANGAN